MPGSDRPQSVFTVSRSSVEGLSGFVPWRDFRRTTLRSWVAEGEFQARACAEESHTRVQPIPSAILVDSSGNYCVVKRRRSAENRSLSARTTMVFGGHVDAPNDGQLPSSSASLLALFSETLLRELEEELDIPVDPLGLSDPLGLLVDDVSLKASRHVALLYHATLDRMPQLLATEEFSLRSRFKVQFFSRADLSDQIDQMDPWSKIAVAEHLCRGSLDMSRHRELPIWVD